MPSPSLAPPHRTDGAPRDRRRHWRGLQVVEGFHLKFVVTTCAYIALLLFVACAIVLAVPMIALLRSGEQAGPEIADRFLLLHAWVWPCLIVTLALVAVIVVFMTHRVAGPLVRFRRVFAQVRAGRLPAQVRLRRGDFLWQEAEDLEAMLAGLRGFHDELRARVEALQATARAVDAEARQSAPSLQAPAAELARDIDTLAALAGRFAAEPPEGPAVLQEVPRDPRPDRRAADGFTLVEVMLVCLLIGVLAALAIPNYREALEAARVTRAIADIRTVDREISVFCLREGRIPVSLNEIGRHTLRDPWDRTYFYLPIPPGKNPKGARKDRNLHPLNSDFDLYSAGKDGKSQGPITAKASQDDVIRANDGGYVGLASKY